MKKLMLAGAVFAAAFAPAAAGRAFEFSSGGAYHLGGHGEWVFAVNDAGEMTIAHNVCDEDVSKYGPYELTSSQVGALWDRVDAAALADVDFPVRPGVPDEVRYRFEVRGEGEDVVLEVWVNDAREHAGLVALVNCCGALIHSYAGIEPVLW